MKNQMTKEEALHILDLMYDVADELHENTDGDEWYWKQMQALTMAIKSLKGE